jgi:hypothetical protein
LDGFTQAVKWVLDVVDVKNINSTVKLEINPKNGETKFSTSSMVGDRTFNLTGDLESDEDLTTYEMSANVLKKAVDRFMGNEIVLESTNANMVITAGIKVKIPLLSTYLTNGTKKKFDLIGTVTAQDLFDAAKYLSPITDPGASSPRLACLDFTVSNDNTIVIMATDRFTFSTREVSYSSTGDTKECRFLITADDVHKLNSLKDSGTVDISENKANVLFSFYNGATATVKKVVDEPVDYSSIIQKNRDGESSFVVNTAQLSGLVNTAATLSEMSNDVYIKVTPTALDIYNKGEIVHAPLAIEAADFDNEKLFVFGYEVIKETLMAISTETVKFKFLNTDDGVFPVVWGQLKSDGTEDESTYLLSLPLQLD